MNAEIGSSQRFQPSGRQDASISLVDGFQCEIRLEPQRGGGTCFLVSFPAMLVLLLLLLLAMASSNLDDVHIFVLILHKKEKEKEIEKEREQLARLRRQQLKTEHIGSTEKITRHRISRERLQSLSSVV